MAAVPAARSQANRCVGACYIKSNGEMCGSVPSVWIRQSSAIDCHHFLFLETNYDNLLDGLTLPLIENINLDSMRCADASVNAVNLSATTPARSGH